MGYERIWKQVCRFEAIAVELQRHAGIASVMGQPQPSGSPGGTGRKEKQGGHTAWECSKPWWGTAAFGQKLTSEDWGRLAMEVCEPAADRSGGRRRQTVLQLAAVGAVVAGPSLRRDCLTYQCIGNDFLTHVPGRLTRQVW